MVKTFEVISGTMVCSDPCYTIEPPTWCQGIISNVRKGTWGAGVSISDEGSWGDRVSRFWVYNLEAIKNNPKLLSEIESFRGEVLVFSAGVDSGQFGFFDKDFYRNDEMAKDLEKYHFGDDEDDEDGYTWYRAACNLTLGSEQWGVMPNGALSSSGYGDGSYQVIGIKDGEEYVAFCVEFIGDDEDYDDEDDED
jgi:Protein of unknown function (DUF4241)